MTQASGVSKTRLVEKFGWLSVSKNIEATEIF